MSILENNLSADGGAGNMLFIRCAFGKMIVERSEPGEGTETRTNKEGRQVHELKFEKLSDVNIVGMRKKVGQYNGQRTAEYQLKLSNDAGELCALTFSESSKYTDGFFGRVESIDLKKPVTFRVGSIFVKEKNKSRPFLVVEQDGQTIDHLYPYGENHSGAFGEKPSAKPVTINGQTHYDFSKIIEWQDKLMNKFIPAWEVSEEVEEEDNSGPADQMQFD